MEPSLPQRRRPYHDVLPVPHRPTIVFVTACTRGRRPILANGITHDAIVDAWTKATAWQVGRYVIMPDHVHLFATPGANPVELGRWVMFWKSRLARTIGKNIWQEGYWDRTLRREDSYADKWAYVRDNPVRKGLVDVASAWPFGGTLNELTW